MKAKWLGYYKNISNIYLLRIIFYSCCKLDSLSDCLDIYYKYLGIPFDVHALIRNVRKLFYTLYNEYDKYYNPSFNINFERDTSSMQAPTNRVGKGYQMLFQRIKKS